MKFINLLLLLLNNFILIRSFFNDIKSNSDWNIKFSGK